MSCPDDTSNCTFATCPKACAQLEYAPTVPGNAVYLAAFALLLVAQAFLGVRYRTWGFLVGMVCGLVLEVVGYAGRILLHNNPFDQGSFIMYLVCLTIAPAFLSGSLYLCLSRLIVVQGPQHSRFSPRTISLTFMFSDFVSLVLQAAGGGIAATGDTKASNDEGRDIMVAGLAWQVASLALYLAAWGDFALRARRSTRKAAGSYDMGAPPPHQTGEAAVLLRDVRSRRRFRLFQLALLGSTVLILIRSIYRVVELQGGFNGAIANNEAAFMVFEGPMIIVAVALMVVWHPGYAFAGAWDKAGWSVRKGYKAVDGGRGEEGVREERERMKGGNESDRGAWP